MVKETSIQRSILDGVEALGGWGVKASNSFLGGIPDLDIVVPAAMLGIVSAHKWHGIAMKIEIKKIEAMPVRMSDKVKFAHPLTVLQDKTIMDIRKAGGIAGWMAIYRNGRDTSVIVGSRINDIPTKEEFLRCAIPKAYSQKWARVLPGLLHKLVLLQ